MIGIPATANDADWNQTTRMKFDPAFGTTRPEPSTADAWREWHGGAAWLFNPWTGERRNVYDIGSDVFGLLIVPPKETIGFKPFT